MTPADGSSQSPLSPGAAARGSKSLGEYLGEAIDLIEKRNTREALVRDHDGDLNALWSEAGPGCPMVEYAAFEKQLGEMIAAAARFARSYSELSANSIGFRGPTLDPQTIAERIMFCALDELTDEAKRAVESGVRLALAGAS